MKLMIYANLTARKPEATATGASLTWPEFTAGDKVRIGVRFLEMIENTRVERLLPLKSAKLSLGLVDAAPTAGTWRIKIGAGASTPANTTPPLPVNIFPSALASSLNALDVVTGALSPVTVEQIGASWVLRFGAGEDVAVSVTDNKLEPEAFARVRKSDTAGKWETEIRLMQAPLASTATFTREVPEPPKVTTLQEGNTDPSETYFTPEIQKITIPALFRGTWQLRYGLDAKSRIFGLDESAEDMQDAINDMFAPAGWKVSVVSPASGEYMVVFDGKECLGLDVDEMEATVFDAPEGDVIFDLNLNTREVFRSLASSPLRQDCVLELEAVIANDGEDPAEPESPDSQVTLFQSPVKLRAELQWDALAASASVDWLRPPTRKSYIPFTPDQILTGQQQGFQTVIGDGEETEFAIDHNLSSQLCQIIVRENADGGRLLKPDEYDVVFDSEDSLTITFPSAPATNEFAILCVAIGPESVFQDHTHTIAQVVGLQGVLGNLTSRVTDLEAILPSTGPGATTAQPSGIKILLPETKRVLFFKGDAKEIFDEKTGIKADKLGRAPVMFPAIHLATPTNYASGPLPASAAGTVWQNTTGAAIPMGRGVYGGAVPNNGYFGSDGRALYAVQKSGSTKSYFPTGFDIELWRIFVNDKMLRLNRTLDVQFAIALQLANATSNAQWQIVIEHGTAPSESTPSPTNTNLENVVWTAAPLLSQRLILTGNRQTHSIGARIKRSLVTMVDTITADTMLYGVWEGANDLAPATPNFALRARLIHFDTENALQADARGWIACELLGAGDGADKPKAVIT